VTGQRRPRASFYSLGCKVNQYEIRETASDLLRRASRLGDDPLVIATGCYADMAPEAAAAVPGVTLVVPNAEKPRLAEIADDLLRRSGRLLFDLDPSVEAPAESELVQLLGEAEGALARTRAVIKIQDGCNHFCSFCIIPFARGRLRSRPPAEIVEEARRLAAQGYRELVLTGICIGDYGDERHSPAARPDRDPLALLLEELAGIQGIDRLRLSSVDPADVTDDLLQTMARLPQACPHLHLSLQAGSNRVLQRMRRRYNRDDFQRLLERIYSLMPGAGLTSDVIAGFPGESEEEFQQTLSLCEEARFCRIHAFPYSPRSGTQAARWDDDIPHAEKSRRVDELRRLAERLGHNFASDQLDQTVEVLVESETRSGALTGLAPNYLKVEFEGDRLLRGEFVQVQLESAGAAAAWGTLV